MAQSFSLLHGWTNRTLWILSILFFSKFLLQFYGILELSVGSRRKRLTVFCINWTIHILNSSFLCRNCDQRWHGVDSRKCPQGLVGQCFKGGDYERLYTDSYWRKYSNSCFKESFSDTKSRWGVSLWLHLIDSRVLWTDLEVVLELRHT